MIFRRDIEQEGQIWVDRGVDDKVDHFQPCEICDSVLNARDLQDRVWQQLELCRPCNSRLEIESGIEGVKNERPYNLDPVPEVLSNDRGFLRTPHHEPRTKPYWDDE